MNALSTVNVTVGILGFLAASAFAQTPTTPTVAPDAPPAVASTPPTHTPPGSSAQPVAPPSSEKTFSSEFSFQPTASEKKEAELRKKAMEDEIEEKPRNGIVRLPKYTVEGERPAVFTEKEINTKKGLGEIAVKRYLSPAQQALNKLALPSWLGGLSNEDLALQMYQEDERLSNMRDLGSEASLFQQAGDKESADSLRADSQDMYVRPRDPAQPSLLRSSDSAFPSNNLNR